MQTNAIEIRRIIDEVFALQWCRENIVVPLGHEPDIQNNNSKLIIAIGNISYLGTIGDFIKKRAADKGMECIFVEKAPEEIQQVLDMQHNSVNQRNDLKGSNSVMNLFLTPSKVQMKKALMATSDSTSTTVMSKSLKNRPLIYPWR